ADPENDAPRLILADWLDEHGEADRAEFIRLQCAAAALPPWDWRRLQAEVRSQFLLRQHEKAWVGPWFKYASSRRNQEAGGGYTFHRGVMQVHFASLDAVEMTRSRPWTAASPWPWLEGVQLGGLDRHDALREVLPRLKQFSALELRNYRGI